MPLARLELVSAHGDQTLPRVRFVVHGTSNATDVLSILNAGLRFTQGRPTVSTNIVHAHDWMTSSTKQAQSLGVGSIEGQPGSVILCAVPAEYYLGYGIFTTAYVDRQLKRVSGAPLRYAASRKQLAFYATPDTEAARLHVESEVANGYSIDQQPQYLIDTRYLIGTFEPGVGFDAIVNQLDVAIRAFEPLEYGRYERALQDIIRLMDSTQAVLAGAAIRAIIVGTIESIIISRLRMMRWQGLSLLGFRFYEGKSEIEITPVRDIIEQRRRMDEMGRMLASSGLFSAELSWLKAYVAQELELMRVELDGAELASLSD